MLSFGHPNFYRFLEPIHDLADHIERRFQEIIIRCDYSLAEGADFIGVMGALLLQAAQDQFKAYRIDSTAVVDTLPPPTGQDQIPLRPD